MSANINDLMRVYFDADEGESLNDAMRRFLGIDADPTLNLQDAIAASDWANLGGDDLYAFFEAGPGGADYQALVAATSGLIAYWKLDETSGTAVADSGGNGNDGFHSDAGNSNQASLLASGVGKSANYNATNTIVTNDSLLELAGSLSIEAIIRPTVIPPTGQTWILSKDNSYGLGFHDGKLAFLIRDTNGTYNYLDAPSTGSVVIDTIYHVVGTWDNATKTQRLYIDGALVSTGSPLSFGVNVNISNITFGSWPDGGERYSGRIDELALYNVALSGAIVLEHAEAALGA